MDSPDSSARTAHEHLVEGLRRHLTGHGRIPVEVRSTHISTILLTPTHAYKLKKPVCLPFVDFRTLSARRHFCQEEVRLNRRLSPTLYLDVVPVAGPPDDPAFADCPMPIDFAVRMRRFEPGALLGERLAQGTLQPEHLESLAETIAAFHRTASVVPHPVDHAEGGDAEAAAAVIAPVVKVLDQLEAALGRPRLAVLRAWVERQAVRLSPVFAARSRDGFVRDGHGDLHLDNAVVLDGGTTAFDCLEFDEDLRHNDVVSDVAFLSMDLKARGRPDLAHRFVDAWLTASGDYGGLAVLRFHEVYRALVRALVVQVHGGGTGADYLNCARALATEATGRPTLMITHGLSGSGKSTIARTLVELTGAVRVRSDVERKRLFGLGARQSSSAASVDLYSTEASERTYTRLAECAVRALDAGYAVIVDAVFLRRRERQRFAELASGRGADFTILACRANPERLRERIIARAAVGADSSEATPAVLVRQQTALEPLAPRERGAAIIVETDAPADVSALASRWLSRRRGPQARFG